MAYKHKPVKKWIGLPATRFFKYRNWINNQRPGICGTYCAAVLVHDAIYEKTKKRLNKETLLNGLKLVVDDLMPYRGTFFWDIAHGIRRIFGNTRMWNVKVGILTERLVPELLSGDNPRPVIVGTTKFLNSKYKNHWVVVYAYGYDENNKLYYRAYDNHGSYNAVIPASQTFSCVWLEEREDKKGELYNERI